MRAPRFVSAAAACAASLLLAAPTASAGDGGADACTPGRLADPAPEAAAFEAFLEEARTSSAAARYSALEAADTRRHPAERDADCRRWLLSADASAPQRLLELPAQLPAGLACVAPAEVVLEVQVTTAALDESFPAAWLLAAGEPLVALHLADEPMFWGWDPARGCAVRWPLPLAGEVEGTQSGSAQGSGADEDGTADHAETHAWPLAGGTRLVLATSSEYEHSAWTRDVELGCTHGGTSWSSSVDWSWTLQRADGTEVELAVAEEADGASDPDDDFECDTWTRTTDAMEMHYQDGGRLEVGLDDDEIEAQLEACRASGSKRCTEKRLADERPATERGVPGFFLDRHEVTQQQYAQCVAAGACPAIAWAECEVFDGEGWAKGRELPPAWRGDTMPQLCVTRAEAADYCAWAGARLPTELEWEVAAVGDVYRERIFPWGDAWQADAAVYLADETRFGPQPVATHPNGDSAHGIADLAGNLYEWVDGDACALEAFPDEDWQALPCTLPDAPSPEGVVRGGSFASDGGALRSTYRRFVVPEARLDTNGFRCAMDGPTG